MKLEVENVGLLNNGYVEIKGSTVVAGKNNTGKSTIGRTLFALLNSLNHTQEQIFSEVVRFLPLRM